MGVLRCDHPDILEFVQAKANASGRQGLSNFNLSVGLTNQVMWAYEDGGDFPLRAPDSGDVVGKINARQLISEIAASSWRTGEPGILFLDRINADNPVPDLGPIEATNPCGEAPLLPFEACCLGGLNVARFFDARSGKFLWENFADTAKLALRMMDNVLEATRFPLREIESATLRTRKVGIGLMGLADLLIDMNIPYGSPNSIDLVRKVMRCVREATTDASTELGRKRGSFPMYASSKFAQDVIGTCNARRNATTTSNAPNSTISVIASCSQGIEPLFALAYERSIENGKPQREIYQKFISTAQSRGFWSENLARSILHTGSIQDVAGIPVDVKEIYLTARDIHPDDHVRIQAACQENTDLGVSKTINLPHNASPDDIERAFILAWSLQCKGITCFRDGCMDNQFLLVETMSDRSVAEVEKIACVQCT